jgi:hypothetical protein
MTAILAHHGWVKAVVEATDTGVRVAIYRDATNRRRRPDLRNWKLIASDEFPGPMHLVLRQVQELIDTLPPGRWVGAAT